VGWLILILVLLAVAFGVLGVLKAVAFIVLTVLLTIIVLVAIGWYTLKHQTRKLLTEADRRIADQSVEQYRHDDDGELPPPRDDRY
jgi:membrane protein required for beta-lactamase induction